MTDTIAFIADSHLGGDETGFCHQPRRPDLLADIFAGLARGAREFRFDLLVHGGDVIEGCAPERIDAACELLGSVGLPVAVALGNHDLTWAPSDGAEAVIGSEPRAEEAPKRDAARLGTPARGCVPLVAHPRASARGSEIWRTRGQRWSHIAFGDRVVCLRHADVIVLDNVWLLDGRFDWRWAADAPCIGDLADTQLRWLDEQLASAPGRPAVLALHAPLDPIPPRLTGLDRPIHDVPADYADRLNRLLDRHRRVKLVLAGHNHATTLTAHGSRLHATVSALLEPPFQFRLIRVGPDALAVETLPAIPMPPGVEYLPEKAWAAGQPQDRQATLRWPSPEP